MLGNVIRIRALDFLLPNLVNFVVIISTGIKLTKKTREVEKFGCLGGKINNKIVDIPRKNVIYLFTLLKP